MSNLSDFFGSGNGTVGTFGAPIDNDFAKFTDAITVEGRSKAEMLNDLNVEDGANITNTARVDTAGAVMESDFDANTFLYAVADNTPITKTRANTIALLDGQSAGNFSMNVHKITNVVDPTANQDAATKKYVDDNGGGGGDKITEGNTSVECVDTGDGHIVFTEDGAEVGRFTGGNLALENGFSCSDSMSLDGHANYLSHSISCFSTTNHHYGRLRLRKSASNTEGTVTETANNEALGCVQGWGVNSSNAFATAADISIKQDGAAGVTYVPGEILFRVATSSTDLADIATISNNGLSMNTHKIAGVVDPTTDQEAATKKYVDDNASGVNTSGTPVANDFAKFTDANTIEGRSYSEVRTDLGLVLGTDIQAYDADLTTLGNLAKTNNNIIVANGMLWTTAAGGTAMFRDAEDSLTDGANLPDGAAIKTYGDANWGGGGAGVFVNAADYTGTDRAKIQAAINEAQTNKGIVYIPGGTWTVDDHDTDGHCLEITSGITIIGDGQHETCVRTADNNAAIFHINTDQTVNISQLGIENIAASPTTGANGITVTSNIDNNYSTFEKLILKNCDIGIALLNATLCNVLNCKFYSTYTYGILINNTYSVDSGEHYIDGNRFSGDVISQLRIESGGGSRISGNNFLDGNYGLDLSVRNGTTTSVLIINGNKFEQQKINSIILRNYPSGTTGIYEKVIISDNEFCEDCYNGTSRGISVNGYDSNTFRTITINDNVAHGGGIDVGDCTNIAITGNVMERQSVTRNYGINFTAAPVGDVIIGGNSFTGYSVRDVGGTAVNAKFPCQSSGNNYIYSDAGSGHDSYYSLLEGGAIKSYLQWDGSNTYLKSNVGDIYIDPAGGDVLIDGDVYIPTGAYFKGQGTSPGLWLDETGTGNKGALLTVDDKDFQIQRRATNFGNYETTSMRVNLSTGNATFAGTVTASCGTLTCDYVFEDDYDLMSLDNLQDFVKNEKELPNMTINEGGAYSTATLREELVEKVEEQALYILQLHERLKVLETR